MGASKGATNVNTSTSLPLQHQQQQQQQQQQDRRAKLRASESNSRATPSPVLTTEQLYDTAGWQDLSGPEWRAEVEAKSNAYLNAQASNRQMFGNNPGSNVIQDEKHQNELVLQLQLIL